MKKFPSDHTSKDEEVEAIAKKHLGSLGRMVGGSKSIYRHDNPNNIVIFNANVATKKHGKIWYGDLDITLDVEDLKRLSKELGMPVFAFYESQGRFGKEENLPFPEAAFSFTEDSITINDITYYEVFDGIPRLKKIESVETKADSKKLQEEADAKYLEKDCEGEFDLPDFSKYKVSAEESPIDYYQNFLIKKLGRAAAQEVFLDFTVAPEYENKMKELLQKYAKKANPGMHEVKVQQAIAFTMLDVGPRVFDPVAPSWAKANKAYIFKGS